MHTPWGQSDGQQKYGHGIRFVSTPSHGGLCVDGELMQKMPKAFISGNDRFAQQRAAGWFEEDCDWAFVAISFPSHFSPQQVADATRIIRDTYPDEYEAAYGCVIPLEESAKKRQREFRKIHRNDWVTVSARYSSTHEGFTEVTAAIGGMDEQYRYDNTALKKFLVPSEEYTHGEFSFVVDPSRHQEMVG